MTDGGDTLSQAIELVNQAVAAGQLSSDSGTNICRWLSPVYSRYHEQLLGMIHGQKFEELEKLFWEVVAFGTGGRRGTMGDLGTATINERTIAESAHGLGMYLKKQPRTSDTEFSGRAVVTCDTRNRSEEFAKLTATTLAANGLQVFFFPTHANTPDQGIHRSTPQLSFAVRNLNCDVGAMISASHNPPSDNGFKAYWNTGAQVLAPHDEGIIKCVYEAEEIPTIDFQQAIDEGKIVLLDETADAAYIDAVAALSLSDQRDISAIYTPLHGVGETSIWQLIQQLGFNQVELLEEQRAPVGDFPNVANHYPNPERPEVFKEAIARAQETGAELILASDPDADRLGMCVKKTDGSFQHLTGNQIGILLADYVVRKRLPLTPDHYVVETLVTTPLIGSIAKSHGLKVVDDLLVGFKYIAQTMDAEGPENFVFGAEESLGYLAGSYCRDKDASIAAMYILEAAAELKAKQKSLLDRLDELYCEHGYHQEGQTSKVCEGPTGREQIAILIENFRTAPPTELAGMKLAQVRDYGTHEIRSLPGNMKDSGLPQPEGNVLFLDSAETDDGFTFSIAVRPSGTEPKIKFYYFATAPCPVPENLTDVKSKTCSRMQEIKDALSSWLDAALKD